MIFSKLKIYKTILPQPDNPSFIIPGESGSSVAAMPSHDVHDPTTPNEGEIRKTMAALIPLDIVYLRQRTTHNSNERVFQSFALPRVHEPSGNVLINSLPHFQPTSSSSSESASHAHESCSNSKVGDSNLPIAI